MTTGQVGIILLQGKKTKLKLSNLPKILLKIQLVYSYTVESYHGASSGKNLLNCSSDYICSRLVGVVRSQTQTMELVFSDYI
jgi:hypothetical protein